jgi:YD repeat-containing protein
MIKPPIFSRSLWIHTAALFPILMLCALSAQAQTAISRINCGGVAISPYSADGNFSGGNSSTTTGAIATDGIANPAPQAVYQTERWGACTYTFVNLTAGAIYLVRLHFAEIYFYNVGQRKFSVALQGENVLLNYDIYAEVGHDKAAVKEFRTSANPAGQIIINLQQGSADNPKISGIEILSEFSSNAAEPNYIRSQSFMECGLGAGTIINSLLSSDYSDGLGRNLQTRVELSSTRSLINFSEYDDAGRLSKSWKGFPYTFPGSKEFTSAPFIAPTPCPTPCSATAYYNDAAPYSASVYSDDPLSRVQAAGGPGKKYLPAVLQPTPTPQPSDDHGVYSWYFGRVNATPLPLATCQNLSATPAPTPISEDNARYFLTVTKDANGGFSQTFADIFGRVVTRWTHDGGSQNIASTSSYDVLGNLISENPPEGGLASSTYDYNTLGQLSHKFTPDANDVDYKYDLAGRIIGSRNANQSQLGTDYTATVYDGLGRVIAIGIAAPWSGLSESNPPAIDNLALIKIRNFYDNVASIAELKIPDNIVSSLQYLKGKLVASVAYDNSGSSATNHLVADVYSYDEEGRVKVKYKMIPGLGIQKFAYAYNRQGQVQTETWYDDIAKSNNKAYIRHYFNYNFLGQLVSIHSGNNSGGTKIAKFTYDEMGRMVTKELCNGGGTSFGTTSFSYKNIEDWIASIGALTGGLGFSEVLDYNTSVPAGKENYNGNISRAAYTYSGISGVSADSRQYDYTYDKANRLVAAHHTSDNSLDEGFSYKADGRIDRKVKGTLDPNTGTQYAYYGNSSRLLNNPIKNRPANFIYDRNGNQVVDKSKKIVTIYDWRDMPVMFKFYLSLPSDINWPVTGLDESQLVSQVAMMYDAAGDRVLKTEYAKNAQ